MANYKEKLKKIGALIFDYDGVLTDGNVIIMNGIGYRTANVKDGYALQLAVKEGLNIAIISGGNSGDIHLRADILGIKDVFTSVSDKLEVFQEYIKTKNIKAEDVLYMGDDIPDMNVMKQVGIACCPADASEEVKQISEYISHKKGGKGCVRDIVEQVLKSQNKWMTEKAFSW